MSQKTQENILSVKLWPHRSLSRNGFQVLMIIFAGLAVVSGVIFLSIGAWPVFGFLGLDILLLLWAFRASYRSAQAFEEITISREEVHLKRVSPTGVMEEWRFNPFWAKLQIKRDPEERVVELAIMCKGQTHVFASFLGPQEKEEFSAVIGAALAEARG